jgi:polymorphic membrane protein
MSVYFNLVFYICVLFVSTGLRAKIIYVDYDNGSDSYNGLYELDQTNGIDGPKKTTESALWLVVDGDTVQLADQLSHVMSSPRFIDSSITIRSKSGDSNYCRISSSGGNYFLSILNATVNIEGIEWFGGNGGVQMPGAMRIRGENSFVTISKNKFTENQSNNSIIGPGAILIDTAKLTGAPKVIINDSEFYRNRSNLKSGGAITMSNGQLYIYRSIFNANSAFNLGGAIRVGIEKNLGTYENTLHIYNSSFLNNQVKGGDLVGLHANGGAVHMQLDTNKGFLNSEITGSVFYNNYAATAGGAVYNSQHSTVKLIRNIFSGNSSTIEDGGAYYRGGNIGTGKNSSYIEGCLFYNNYTSNYGGAIYIIQNSGGIELKNSTFYNNTAELGGDSIYSANQENGTKSSAINTIFWSSNKSSEIVSKNNDSWALLSYSDIKGGLSSVFDSNVIYKNNINIDPSFIDEINNVFYLSAGSACIDTGFGGYISNPADMGAFEKIQ